MSKLLLLFFAVALFLLPCAGFAQVKRSFITSERGIYFQAHKAFSSKKDDPFGLPYRVGHSISIGYYRNITEKLTAGANLGYGFFPQTTSNSGGITKYNQSQMIPFAIPLRYGFRLAGNYHISLNVQAGSHFLFHQETNAVDGSVTRTDRNLWHCGYGFMIYSTLFRPWVDFTIINAGNLTFRTVSLKVPLFMTHTPEPEASKWTSVFKAYK